MKMKIAIDEIRRNPDQPRKRFDEAALEELASSIREDGIIVPLLVRPVEEGYQIVHGERRWRAAKMAGLRYVRCEVRELDDVESFYTSLIENLQRQDLNSVEEARAIKHLMGLEGLSMRKAAERIGKSAMYISLKMKMLKDWPVGLQDLLASGAVNEAVARALYKLFCVWWDYDVGPAWYARTWLCIWTTLRLRGKETAKDIEDYAEILRYNLCGATVGVPGDHWERVRDTYSGCATSQVLEASGRWVEEMMWAWMKHNEWFPEPRDETMPGRRTARQRERVRS